MYRLALIISLITASALAQDRHSFPQPTTVGHKTTCESGDWCLTISFVTITGLTGSTTFVVQDRLTCESTAAQIMNKLTMIDHHPGLHAKDTGAVCTQTK